MRYMYIEREINIYFRYHKLTDQQKFQDSPKQASVIRIKSNFHKQRAYTNLDITSHSE